MFRKKTHTDSYLHADSHHHPSQKIGVLNTLAIRASRIADSKHIKKEEDHLKEVFKNIGYKPKVISKTLNKTHNKSLKGLKTSTTTNPRAYLPYIQGVTDKISRILMKNNITTSFKPLETIRKRMRSVKYLVDHTQFRGVYKIPCSCKISYIGETGRSFHTRIKEHGANIRKERIRSSALAKHVAKTKHHIFLEDTIILAKEDHYFKRKFREALEITKLPHNLNRDGGLEVSTSWLPPILNRKGHYVP